MKKILVLNGSPYEENIIRIFKNFGLYVITSGNIPSFSGHKLANKYICHDYSDRMGMLKIAEENSVDYVCACSNDFGVLTAAYIAESMGLPGHDTLESARIIAEKDLFKSFAQKNKLQVIPSHGFQDFDSAISYAMGLPYPIIIKPVDLTGGKGVTKVDHPNQAEAAIRYAFERSRAKRIVIEPYIVGTQHSITTFLLNQKVAAYGSFNEGDANSAFLVGYSSSPADNENTAKDVLIPQIEKIAALLHLEDGIFHAQYRMNGEKPLIMECMRRILGNHALESLEMSTGINWEYWEAMNYLGQDCRGIMDSPRQSIECSEYYIQAPSNGTVREVWISPALEMYIKKIYVQWHPGQVIEDYMTEKLCFLFLSFPDVETRRAICQNINQYIHVVMN